MSERKLVRLAVVVVVSRWGLVVVVEQGVSERKLVRLAVVVVVSRWGLVVVVEQGVSERKRLFRGNSFTAFGCSCTPCCTLYTDPNNIKCTMQTLICTIPYDIVLLHEPHKMRQNQDCVRKTLKMPNFNLMNQPALRFDTLAGCLQRLRMPGACSAFQLNHAHHSIRLAGLGYQN